MLQNSPTNTFNFKKFPGVIPRTPVKGGWGGEGEEALNSHSWLRHWPHAPRTLVVSLNTNESLFDLLVSLCSPLLSADKYVICRGNRGRVSECARLLVTEACRRERYFFVRVHI